MRKRMNKLVAGLLTAVTLTTTVVTPAFAAEKGTNEVKDTVVTENVTSGYHFSTDEVLDNIAAMEIKDSAKKAKLDHTVECERGLRQYGIIKRYMMQKGPNPAFILGIYYVPSPIMYEVIQEMEKEVKSGNCAYIYDGQYYESPAEDPTFYVTTSVDAQ